jgi:hypothetical protein
MSLPSIVSVIMRRDNLSLHEAIDQVNEAREAVAAGFDPEEACYEFFGLEPDYCFDLMEGY